MIRKIISGCQTGADEAGLRAAKDLGLETGGFMPAGFRTETGNRPDLAKLYNLECTQSRDYPDRTKANVRSSDATIIFGRSGSPGSRLTARLCDENDKPVLRISTATSDSDAVRMIRKFIVENNVQVLNVAGNREQKIPGIGEWVHRILVAALS